MISSNTIIFVCIIIKAEAILAENEADQRELFAIENSLHELRTCSQSLDNGRVPEFCYTRQSPRANELSRKSRSFWEMRGQDEQCLKTPCSRKSHKITTKKLEMFLGGWTPIAITTETKKIELGPNDEIDLASCSGNCWASDNAARQLHFHQQYRRSGQVVRGCAPSSHAVLQVAKKMPNGQLKIYAVHNFIIRECSCVNIFVC